MTARGLSGGHGTRTLLAHLPDAVLALLPISTHLLPLSLHWDEDILNSHVMEEEPKGACPGLLCTQWAELGFGPQWSRSPSPWEKAHDGAFHDDLHLGKAFLADSATDLVTTKVPIPA